jgi:D-serine deaminase-like pyridoxal phosphate-dependent protein
VTQPPPAEIGMEIAQVDTPALVVDRPAFERNLARMADFARDAGIALRPHAKTHKCPAVARRQVELGAVGQCCQKVGEAEAMVAGGITDVLVTNEIVGAAKIRRLVDLASRATVGVCVDDPGNAAELSAAAAAAGVTLDVYVEIDVGAGRCGVEPGSAAAGLAARVADLPALRFAGLQAYHGSAQHIGPYRDRRAAIEAAADDVRATLAALAAAGLDCPAVTGAGTGSYAFEAASGLWTELQCGSYALMDVDYRKVRDATGAVDTTFENALTVLVTVMSRNRPGRAIVDAGHKALGNDQGFPHIVAEPGGGPDSIGLRGATYSGPSDEHGTVTLAGNRTPALGEKLRLIPGHVDPTVNLYDWFAVVDDGIVVDLWEITSRGAVR